MWSLIYHMTSFSYSPPQFGRERHQQQRCQSPESSPLGEPDANFSQVRTVRCLWLITAALSEWSFTPWVHKRKLHLTWAGVKILILIWLLYGQVCAYLQVTEFRQLLWSLTSHFTGRYFATPCFSHELYLTAYHLTSCLSFSLRNNNIGSKGARFLAEALKMNQVLVSIK